MHFSTLSYLHHLIVRQLLKGRAAQIWPNAALNLMGSNGSDGDTSTFERRAVVGNCYFNFLTTNWLPVSPAPHLLLPPPHLRLSSGER